MNQGERLRKSRWGRVLLLGLLVACCGPLFASTTVLLEEPYGLFGHVNPTGHAAIYFDHICAATPTRLRHCGPGELGVVVSRYHRVDGYDWVAIPLVPYLYAVESLKDVPTTADQDLANGFMDRYRREHLRRLAPDGPDGTMPKGDWVQLVGASYIRKIYAFQIDSTVDQDDELIRKFNDSKNVSHFNLLFRNCADFSRKVINSVYPKAVHRNFIADFGLTTPKQVAMSVVKYGKKNPDLNLSVYIIPQVPGSIERSRRVDGIAESLIRSKKYVVPLVFLAPVSAGIVVAAWITGGHLKLPKEAPTLEALQPNANSSTLLAERWQLEGPDWHPSSILQNQEGLIPARDEAHGSN